MTTSLSISFVFKGREFRSCDWINRLSESAIDFKKKNRIFEPKRFSEKTTQILQHGISPALSLSFICSVLFWTNKRILHFYPTDFRFCLTPVSKSNITEVPWKQQKYSLLINKTMKDASIYQKRVSTSFFLTLSWVLATRNLGVRSRTGGILKPTYSGVISFYTVRHVIHE